MNSYNTNFILPLWICSAIFIVLRGLTILGLFIPEKVFLILFLLLLVSSIFFPMIFIVYNKKHLNVNVSENCKEELPGEIKENMFIRSNRRFGKEERYILDLEGHVYYKLLCKRVPLKKYTWIFDIYDSNNKKIGMGKRYWEGKRKIGPVKEYKFMAKIDNEIYESEISFDNRKELALPDSMPYIFQYNSRNSNAISVYTKNGKRKKLAETRCVFTEAGYSSANQDIFFYNNSMNQIMILLLAALTLSWATDSYTI